MKIYNTGFHVTDNFKMDCGKHKNGGLPEFHFVTVTTSIVINKQAFEADYSTGATYVPYGKHERYSTELRLAHHDPAMTNGAGTDEMLMYIQALNPKMIEEETQEHLDFVSEFSDDIKTKEDLFQVHLYLNNNFPDIADYKDTQPDD